MINIDKHSLFFLWSGKRPNPGNRNLFNSMPPESAGKSGDDRYGGRGLRGQSARRDFDERLGILRIFSRLSR